MKSTPRSTEPDVLGNRALLRVIAETKSESISALAQATGRKPGKLFGEAPVLSRLTPPARHSHEPQSG